MDLMDNFTAKNAIVLNMDHKPDHPMWTTNLLTFLQSKLKKVNLERIAPGIAELILMARFINPVHFLEKNGSYKIPV